VWGFGAPDSFGGGIVTGRLTFDWGYGDDDLALPIIDWGFGDPPSGDVLAVVVTSPGVLPDDGGEIVRLTAVWPIVGPYRVQLVHRTSGQTFPDLADGFGAAGRLRLDRLGRVVDREFPHECRTDLKQNLAPNEIPPVPGRHLFFVLPVAPPGVYEILVSWGGNYQETVTALTFIRIVRRGRSREQWGARSTFPRYYATGPRTSGLEDPLIDPVLT